MIHKDKISIFLLPAKTLEMLAQLKEFVDPEDSYFRLRLVFLLLEPETDTLEMLAQLKEFADPEDFYFLMKMVTLFVFKKNLNFNIYYFE